MDPHKLARHYIKKFCTDAKGRTTLRHYRGEFWRYEEGCYRALPYLEVLARITRAIKRHVDQVPLVDRFGRAYSVTKGPSRTSSTRLPQSCSSLIPSTNRAGSNPRMVT